MTRLTTLAKLRVPLGGQEIELQEVDFESGPDAGDADSASVPINLLRTRIREGSRFTIFDIDPDTAQRWGDALLQWAREQPRQ